MGGKKTERGPSGDDGCVLCAAARSLRADARVKIKKKEGRQREGGLANGCAAAWVRGGQLGGLGANELSV